MIRLASIKHIEIRKGNSLWIPCVGNHDGKGPCCGRIRVPFSPVIGNANAPEPTGNGLVWKRKSGETLEDITLEPSVDAGVCGHFVIVDGGLGIC